MGGYPGNMRSIEVVAEDVFYLFCWVGPGWWLHENFNFCRILELKEETVWKDIKKLKNYLFHRKWAQGALKGEKKIVCCLLFKFEGMWVQGAALCFEVGLKAFPIIYEYMVYYVSLDTYLLNDSCHLVNGCSLMPPLHTCLLYAPKYYIFQLEISVSVAFDLKFIHLHKIK